MRYCCNKLGMVFTSVIKPFHTKRGICILEAKIIDPDFGERYSFKRTDGTVVEGNDRKLRLTITHCPYCGTPSEFLFNDEDNTLQECP